MKTLFLDLTNAEKFRDSFDNYFLHNRIFTLVFNKKRVVFVSVFLSPQFDVTAANCRKRKRTAND